jgi:hypothetical protein
LGLAASVYQDNLSRYQVSHVIAQNSSTKPDKTGSLAFSIRSEPNGTPVDLNATCSFSQTTGGGISYSPGLKPMDWLADIVFA